MENKEKYICEFCGKESHNAGALANHTKCCKNNPNRIIRTHSEETKKKISIKTKDAMKGMHNKLSQAIKNLWLNDDYRNKTSKSIKASRTDEFKRSMSELKKSQYIDSDIKEKISKTLSGRLIDISIREKIRNALLGSHHSEETKQKIKEVLTNRTPEQKAERNQKVYNTKKQNNTFNSSKIEDELKDYFNSNNIEYIHQYKSNKYPFCCDFYFPQKDLYVEIQGSWTHGGKPFDSTDDECIKQLELWKSKRTDFYDNAIKTWTERDVKKRETAKANNLNWIEIFSNELEKCLDIILKLL